MTTIPFVSRGRLAAFVAAAGLVISPLAIAQTALPPPGQYGQADQRQDRIEALETQLRESTAENERLQFELIQAQREITRLRGMVGELAAANQSALTPETPPESASPAQQHAAPQQQSANPPPAQTGLTPAQQAASGTLGTMPASQPAAPAQQASQAPAEAGPAYSRARELLVRGNYAEAEQAFSDFLRVHASSSTAPDARYWYAFTLLARNNHADAAANFVEYLRQYPNGPRAPDAQVRLGIALAGMGQNRQACSAFNALTTRYPRAPATVRDLAQREARALNCA